MPSPSPLSPTVSVVIPTYNSALWVTDAVRSALAQSLTPLQVIVIDDGSTDDTLQRLQPFADQVTLKSQPNRGVAAARNRALELATGEYIAFLDADDLWHPRKLELQLAALAQKPAIGLLGTRTTDCSLASTIPASPAPTTPISLHQLAIKNYLTTSSVILRRDVARHVGQFDPSLQGPEDHDYWIRAAQLTQVAILEQPLTGYRTVHGSLSRRAASMEKGVRQILTKLDLRHFWRGKPLLRRHAHAYAACASSFLYSDEGNTRRALRKLFESFAWYPLPFARTEVGTPLLRAQRLAALLARLATESFQSLTSRRGLPPHPPHHPHHPVPDLRPHPVQPQPNAAL